MSQKEKERAPGVIWQYGPASDYLAPQPASTEKVGLSLRTVMRRVWGTGQTVDAEERTEFVPLSVAVLDEVMPDSSWSAGTTALATSLDAWLYDPRPHRLCTAVIGPPGSGVREVVTRWGARHSARLAAAPSIDSVLGSTPDWWQDVDPDVQGVLVIPELERFYLRHHDGLDLIRRLIERLWASPRRLVVGCNSWAWAYLCKAVHLDAVFGPPIALMPLDADSLRFWFRPRPRGRYLVQTVRGEHVLYPCESGETAIAKPRDEAASDGKPLAAGAEVFQQIAATARGIPAVALALWRKLLCEADAEAKTDTGKTSQHLAAHPIPVRVRPPRSLTLPSLPSDATTREAIILHTLLLHSRLPVMVLSRLVPFAAPVVFRTLTKLEASGLVSEESDMWRISLLGYPSVRAYLKAEGLLVDEF